MSNRLNQQFPRTDSQAVPPIGPDGLEPYLQRARQLRAEAFAEGLKLTARALARVFGVVVRRVRDTDQGVAQRRPRAHTPSPHRAA
jgi:hypothetical protein